MAENIKEIYDTSLQKEMFRRVNMKKELDLRLKILAIFKNYEEKKNLDKEFHKKMMDLIFEYESKSWPLYKRINEIIKGSRLDSKEVEFIEVHLLDQKESKEKESAINELPVKDYWATALRNCDILANECRQKDWELLNFLKSIDYHKDRENQKLVVSFTFEKNEFLKEEVLHKTFIMSDEDTPIESKGTEIQWKTDKNLTKMKAMMLQRNTKKGTEKREEQITEDESFFNFFKSVNLRNLDNQKDDGNAFARMEIDFDIARVIMDELIPYSLEYYLGIRTTMDIKEKGERSGEKESQKKKGERYSSKNK